MHKSIESDNGLSLETEEVDGEFRFRITAPLPCPPAQARALPLAAALWLRDAVGGPARIQWPAEVTADGRPAGRVTCRVGADTITFSCALMPDAVPDPAAAAAAVADAAAETLAGWPDNRPDIIQRYCNACDTVMRFVDTFWRGMPLYGFAFAVDKNGGLMVMTQETRTVLTVYDGPARIAESAEAPPPDLPVMPGR